MTQKVQEIMTHDVQENMTQKTNLLFVQEIVQSSFDEAIRLQVAVTPPDSQGGQQLKRLRGGGAKSCPKKDQKVRNKSIF